MANEIIETLVKKVERLEREVGILRGLKPLYTVVNVNTPAQLTANQNNYDPGDFDTLVLSSDASRNITGISGGTEGRALWLYNSGSNNIVLVDNSVLSTDVNRILCPGAANVTMTPRATGTSTFVVLIYLLARWRLFFESA